MSALHDALWAEACAIRDEAMTWLQSAKVDLPAEPDTNLRLLHQKAATIRTEANKVRDAVYAAMRINMLLRRSLANASWTYEQAKNTASNDPAVKTRLSSYKTKEERADALQQEVATQYKDYLDAKNHIEEWEQYMKMVNLVYYSLSDTRQDLNTQVSVVKQQMFNGEIKPNGELEKIGSLFDLLGDGAKSLLRTAEAPAGDGSGVPGQSGETTWD